MPQVEVPQVEVPQVEVPQIEVPQVEVPQVEVPRVEVPRVALAVREPFDLIGAALLTLWTTGATLVAAGGRWAIAAGAR